MLIQLEKITLTEETPFQPWTQTIHLGRYIVGECFGSRINTKCESHWKINFLQPNRANLKHS